MIIFKNVTKVYEEESPVLQDVSFEVAAGEFVSIVGKSGAGKSTILKLILGLEEPTSGQVIYKGKEVSKMNDSELQDLRRQIGGVYQDYKLLPGKTVFENVAYILAIEGKNDDEIEEDVLKVLDIMGLHEKVNNFPEELSGGEQQRLAIARAVVNQPQTVIADEPTGNLDPYNTYEVISILEKINNTGKTVILSTHDREIVNKLGKRVITLENGKIIRDEAKGRYII